LEITGLIDWNFAHLAAPISEFLHSLGDFHGLLDAKSLDSDEQMLRHYHLTGFPTDLPISTAKSTERSGPGEPAHIDWQKIKRWDDTLAHVGVRKPSNIDGADGISDLWWFTQQLCPWRCLQERKIEKLGPEKVAKMRHEANKQLDTQL
jgi:hypothetical protein